MLYHEVKLQDLAIQKCVVEIQYHLYKWQFKTIHMEKKPQASEDTVIKKCIVQIARSQGHEHAPRCYKTIVAELMNEKQLSTQTSET